MRPQKNTLICSREYLEDRKYAAASPELRAACEAKNILRVRELIHSSSVSAFDATGCLPAAWPDVEVMRMLLEHGADPNRCATTRYMKHCIEVVKLLVEFGYDIKINGHCILQDFAHDREALDWLLAQGVDISRTDHERTDAGNRPGQCHDYSLKVLNIVAARGDVELFDHLVARGANPHRSLALHCASKCQDPEKATAMIDHLLDAHSMDIEADNEKLRDFFHAAGDSGTPLVCAWYYRNLPAIHKLLQRGANPDKALFTTIDGTITKPWLPALEPLLDAGANVQTAFEYAVDSLNFEAARICMTRGADAAKILERQQVRQAKRDAGTFVYGQDDIFPGAEGDWSDEDEECTSKREQMRDFLRSAVLNGSVSVSHVD